MSDLPDLDLSPEGLATTWHTILTDAREDERVISVRLKSGSLHAGRVIDVGTSTFDLEEKKDDHWYDHVIALTEVAAIVWRRAE